MITLPLTAHDDVYFPGGFTPPGTRPIQTPMPPGFAPPITQPMPGDPSYYRPKPDPGPTPTMPSGQMRQIPDNMWGFFMLMMGL